MRRFADLEMPLAELTLCANSSLPLFPLRKPTPSPLRTFNRRTAYSLRHTYICLRLMEGADIYQIAKNCRTSVEMIEKFYATHIKTSLDAAAINVRRSAPFRRESTVSRS